MSENSLEILIIALYMLLLVGIGFFFSRFNRDASDYFRSGCRGTWWLVGMSMLMGGISAFTFTGNASAAYEAGFSVALIYAGSIIGIGLQVAYFAPRFRQLRVITVPEIIRLRYGALTQQYYAVVYTVYFLFAAALWLWGLSVFSSSVFDLPLLPTIVVIGLVVLVYETAGGNWAVMATDFVQSLVLFSMTFLLAWLAIEEIGGVGAFFQRIEVSALAQDFRLFKSAGEFHDDAYTPWWAVAVILIFVFDNISMRGAVGFFSVKDGPSARKAAALNGACYLVGLTFWFIPPMVARILYSEKVDAVGIPNPAEASYSIAAMELLPSGLLAMMVVAMFAATMSSMDTGLNRNAAMAVRDIYPAVLRRMGLAIPDDQKQMRIGRWVTVFFGACVIAIALFFAMREGTGLFQVGINLMAIIGLPMTIPLVLGLCVKLVPRWAAIATAAGGSALSATLYFGDFGYSYAARVFSVIAVCFGLYFAFWALARWRRDALHPDVKEFFTRMSTPVDFEKEVGSANDHRQMKILGGASLIVGSFAALLAFLAEDAKQFGSVVFVSGFVLLVGSFLLWRSTQAPRSRSGD